MCKILQNLSTPAKVRLYAKRSIFRPLRVTYATHHTTGTGTGTDVQAVESPDVHTCHITVYGCRYLIVYPRVVRSCAQYLTAPHASRSQKADTC